MIRGAHFTGKGDQEAVIRMLKDFKALLAVGRHGAMPKRASTMPKRIPKRITRVTRVWTRVRTAPAAKVAPEDEVPAAADAKVAGVQAAEPGKRGKWHRKMWGGRRQAAARHAAPADPEYVDALA